MKINKLRLKNFKSYEDETCFDFSSSTDKNIILIGGQNGAGKSTIFEAIKLCIYGPLAYNYQDINTIYIHKIKSNINNNSFKTNMVDAFVSVDIELNENTEKNIYTLTRKWTFKDQKLSEDFFVFKNDNNTALTDEEVDHFKNYLKSIIPPNIFEFFFFDGESLSEFFIGRNSNKHLKQSLLSLCNYDTLDVLKSIISKNKSNIHNDTMLANAKENYVHLESKHVNLSTKIDSIHNDIQKIEIDMQDLQLKKISLEKSFREKGGILAEERESLSKRINSLENERGAINQKIKDFCNDMLPFLIIEDKFPDLKAQIEKEDKFLLYYNVKDKLNPEFIGNIIKNTVEKNKIDFKHLDLIAATISDGLLNNIKPDSHSDDNHQDIHMLSNDESSFVLSNINSILDFDKSKILDLYSNLKDINNEILKIREKLNSSLDDDSLNSFISELSQINHTTSELANNKLQLENLLEELNSELLRTESEKEKAKKEYMKLLQTNNIADISLKLSSLLDDIILDLSINKLKEIETHFIYIFKKLIQKDRFIDNISIDSNFNVTLYINKSYNSTEIRHMINNMGYDEMYKKLGHLFFEDLHDYCNSDNKSDLVRFIMSDNQFESLNLRTKVNVNNFSNGEKQIYILCLYWALIKSSKISIPFIIDTPYARIDETHRNNITKEYFSSISDQVIILSTNTEIDFESYKKIKPKVNKEYLIKYDDINRKTQKYKGYFFEV